MTTDDPYTARVLAEHPHGAPYVWLPADWPIGATVIVSLIPGDVARKAVDAAGAGAAEGHDDLEPQGNAGWNYEKDG